MSSVDLCLLDHILSQHFGETNKSVAHALAAKGPLTSAQIGQTTKLTARTVRESLFVLIHHNLVLWSSPKDDLGVQQQPTVYQLALDKVILRLAFPGFISLTARRHGQEAADALMEVVRLGRCPSDLLGKKIFDTLLGDGLIEYIDASKSRLDRDDFPSTSPATSANPSPTKRKSNAVLDSPTNQKKVKFDEGGPKKYVRIALDNLVHCVWFEQLVSHASRRVNDAAGAVLESVLTISGLTAATSKTLLNSFQISHKLPPVTPLLVDSEASRGKAGSALSSYLEIMAQDLPYFVKSGDQAGGQYYLDFPVSIEFLTKNIFLSYITARFGKPSARIFRALLEKKFLEERIVAKISMLSGKEARERLYIMLQHGFVHMQEVPKSADHAPSRTIYLWTIPSDRLKHQFTGNLKKVLVNLMERIQHERSKYRLLITKTERSDVAANPAALLSPLERAQLEALNHVLGRLEFQITRIITEFIILSHLK